MQFEGSNVNWCNCPKCGATIKREDDVCPLCGAKNKQPVSGVLVFFVAIGIIAIVAVCLALHFSF